MADPLIGKRGGDHTRGHHLDLTRPQAGALLAALKAMQNRPDILGDHWDGHMMRSFHHGVEKFHSEVRKVWNG